MKAQAAGAVLLVRPDCFGFNPEAAASNAFATSSADPDIKARAAREFDGLADALANTGVEVLTLGDDPARPKPDAVFPNNWVSFHADGTIVLYPMANPSRRAERQLEKVRQMVEASGFEVRQIVDLSFHERSGHFLEGTGSLVLDRPNRRAFANVSPRTDAQVIADFDDRLDYSTLVFDAHDRSGKPIYHTNVLMSLGTRFAVLCTDVVSPDFGEFLSDELESGGRTLIKVDYEQMSRFACNLIELRGKDGPLIAMSSAARTSFRPDQLKRIERFGELLDVPIPTIESVGGGSVRCMIAEVHLPRR